MGFTWYNRAPEALKFFVIRKTSQIECLTWTTIFEYYKFPEEHHIRFAKMKLEGQANKYWIDVELRLEKANKNLITYEDEMKKNISLNPLRLNIHKLRGIVITVGLNLIGPETHKWIGVLTPMVLIFDLLFQERSQILGVNISRVRQRLLPISRTIKIRK